MPDDALRGQRLTAAVVRQAVRAARTGDRADVAAEVLETDGTRSVVPASARGGQLGAAGRPALRHSVRLPAATPTKREAWAEHLLDRLTPVKSALSVVFLLVVLGEQLAPSGSAIRPRRPATARGRCGTPRPQRRRRQLHQRGPSRP